MSGDAVLCSHCGESVETTDKTELDGEVYHADCLKSEIPECQNAVDAFLKYHTTDKKQNVMFMAIHVSYLYGYKKEQQGKLEKKRKREIKLKQLLRKVSSLRNSNSGSLLVQLVGKDPEDVFTGPLDEFMNESLSKMLEDGKLFCESIHKERMNVYEEFANFSNFVVVRVAAASSLTTADYKNKVAFDDSINNPTPHNIFTFLKEKKFFPEEHPKYDDNMFAEDIANLEESRAVQFKANFKKVGEDGKIETLIYRLVNELKLKENISAFAKNAKGGAYLFGVGEKDKHYDGKKYTSKEPEIHGVELTDEDQLALRESLEKKIEEELLVCDFAGDALSSSDIIKIKFLPFRDQVKFPNKYVLMITVRPVNGLVFTDKEGPQAFKVDTACHYLKSRETNIPLKEWFDIILRHIKNID